MNDLGAVLQHIANSEFVGWSLVTALISSAVWVAVQWIRSSGEISIAKEQASVSLNEQGSALILKMVEEQKTELEWLRSKMEERDSEMRAHLRNSERLCELLISILKAPDDIMRDYQMVQAQQYLTAIGKWENDE
jgi:hypothetical protein